MRISDITEGEVVPFSRRETKPVTAWDDEFEELDAVVAQMKADRALRRKIDQTNRHARGRQVDYMGRRGTIIRSGEKLAIQFEDGTVRLVKPDSLHLRSVSLDQS